MNKNKDIYIRCPRYKGKPRKHISVCRSCRWKGGCKPYLAYLQPGLPFGKSKNEK